MSGSVKLDNGEAYQRSLLLFLAGFVGMTSLLQGIFIGIEYNEPYFTASLVPLAMLASLWAAIILIGFFLTIYRTPRWFRVSAQHETLIVQRIFANPTRVELGGGAYSRLLESYGRTVFSKETCELLEVHSSGKFRRRLVVLEGLLDDYLPKERGRVTREGPRVPQRPSSGEDRETDS